MSGMVIVPRLETVVLVLNRGSSHTKTSILSPLLTTYDESREGEYCELELLLRRANVSLSCILWVPLQPCTI